MRELKLDRPLVFLDIESTGVDVDKDKIIELALVKLWPDGAENTMSRRFNPGFHIPDESSKVHGILDEDVADEDLFCEWAEAVFEVVKDCDLAGFNSNRFDVPLLFRELSDCGFVLNLENVNLVDAGNIFKIKEPRTLEVAVMFYTGESHEGAHGALADTLATVRVLREQLNKYEDLPLTMPELALLSNYDMPRLDISGRFSLDKDGDYVYNFGKSKGTKIKEDQGFLNWMFTKDFNEDTMRVARKIRDEINQI